MIPKHGWNNHVPYERKRFFSCGLGQWRYGVPSMSPLLYIIPRILAGEGQDISSGGKDQ